MYKYWGLGKGVEAIKYQEGLLIESFRANTGEFLNGIK
jgi:hypothetical protein